MKRQDYVTSYPFFCRLALDGAGDVTHHVEWRAEQIMKIIAKLLFLQPCDNYIKKQSFLAA